MIGRILGRQPVPDLDLANPREAYRRRNIEIADRLWVDNEKHMALEMVQLASEDASRLNRHRETLSPWDRAWARLGPAEQNWSSKP